MTADEGREWLTDEDRQRSARNHIAQMQADMIEGQIQFIERAANVRARMEEDALRDEVIKVLRGQGYTVIPPGEGS
jgi:hypothetical protein